MFGTPYWLYMRHEEEKQDIINMMYEAALAGEEDIVITTEDTYSEQEWEDMENEVRKRLGIH